VTPHTGKAIALDFTKLVDLVEQDLWEMRSIPSCIETRSCIGEINGMQIHVVVTRRERDFIDSNVHHCLKGI